MKITAYGLIELLFVIALAAIGLLLSVHYYSQVRLSQKVTELQLQMQGVYKAVLQCVSSLGVNNSNCLSVANLIKTGLLSDSYTQNPWGGNYGISLNVVVSVKQSISIRASQVPTEACTVFQGRIGDNSNTFFPEGTYVDSASNQCTLILPSIQL